MTPARPQPERQQAPPVQRLRLRYAKTGRARFASHRDFSRALERALRRADVPMAYSSGFSPHPRISFANASPTGASTDAEYLEIGLAQRVDPVQLIEALNQALPDGLAITAATEADGGALADRLTASLWRIDLGDVDAAALARAVEALLAADRLLVTRMAKTGLREFDVRAAIISLIVGDDGLIDLLSHHLVPLVRPDDVVRALGHVDPGYTPATPPIYRRLAQGFWDGGRLIDPFTGENLTS